jgi:hypothetical protein
VPKPVSDGTEHAAHVLFTELVMCKRDGDIFYAGGRSKDYHRCGAMTSDYVRELVSQLSALLAEYDAERGIKAPPLDGISLARDGDCLQFALSLDGKPAGAGRVTKDVARKAKAFLDEFFDGPKVVSLRRRGAEIAAWMVALMPALGG